jgi:hypothetical protein
MAVEKSVRVTISAVDEFTNTMGGMALSWNKIAMAAGLAEAAIIAASISAAKFAVDIGTTLFREAAVFHDGMLDVKAVTGEAGASMEEIEQTLNKLVVDFPLTGAQAAEAMELIAQRGNIAQTAMEGLAEAAVTLNIATGSDMNLPYPSLS